MNRGYGGEDDDSHRAGSDQRRRSEGQKNAHAPLHGDDHGQTPRAEQRTPVDTHSVAVYQPLPPHLEVRPEDTGQAMGAGHIGGKDVHAVDQGQTEQAEVHPVLQTCTGERRSIYYSDYKATFQNPSQVEWAESSPRRAARRVGLQHFLQHVFNRTGHW